MWDLYGSTAVCRPPFLKIIVIPGATHPRVVFAGPGLLTHTIHTYRLQVNLLKNTDGSPGTGKGLCPTVPREPEPAYLVSS